MPNIVAANPNDAEEIIHLQRLAYQSEARLYNDWSLAPLTQTAHALREEFKSTVILKATIHNKIIGSVRAKVEEGVCKIGRLIVHPQHQGNGIGSILLAKIEEIHESSGLFELFTGSKSLGNIKFYNRHGYVESHCCELPETATIIFLRKPGKNLTDP